MASSSLWDGVAEVLSLVRDHSEKYKLRRQLATKRERVSGWAALIGGIIFVAGEVVRQADGPKMPSPHLVYLPLLIVGLVVFFYWGRREFDRICSNDTAPICRTR